MCCPMIKHKKKISSHKVLLVSGPYPQQRTQLRTVPRLDFRCLLSADFDPPQREDEGMRAGSNLVPRVLSCPPYGARFNFNVYARWWKSTLTVPQDILSCE